MSRVQSCFNTPDGKLTTLQAGDVLLFDCDTDRHSFTFHRPRVGTLKFHGEEKISFVSIDPENLIDSVMKFVDFVSACSSKSYELADKYSNYFFAVKFTDSICHPL